MTPPTVPNEWEQHKSSQVKSYTHIYMTETNNKDDHHSIVYHNHDKCS